MKWGRLLCECSAIIKTEVLFNNDTLKTLKEKWKQNWTKKNLSNRVKEIKMNIYLLIIKKSFRASKKIKNDY